MSSLTCQILGAVLVVACLVATSFGGPLHASCRVSWSMGEPCSTVQGALVKQIKAWGGPDGCDNGGEKCLYELKTQNATVITLTHTTPVRHFADDVSFNFTQSGQVCLVAGYSRSETWYAVLDYGTNYCNMENLITGAGLNKVTGYQETTSNDICTQFSSADCGKY